MDSKLIEPLNIVITGNLGLLVECGKSAPDSTCAIRAPKLLENFVAAPMHSGGAPLVMMVQGLLRILGDCESTTEAQKLNIDNALQKLDEYLPLIQAVEPGEEPTREQELTKNEPLTKEADLTVFEPTGRMLALESAFAIEPMCDEIQAQAIEANVDSDTIHPCAIITALAMRIKALNSVLMSALDGRDITLAAAAKAVHGARGAEELARALNKANAPAEESDYMDGVAAAIEMLMFADSKRETADADLLELDGTHRPGRPQDNIALDYMREVMKKPELAEGFAAVLTAVIGPNILGGGFAEELAGLDYERMMIPKELRHPETSDLPSESAPPPINSKPAKAPKKTKRTAAVPA